MSYWKKKMEELEEEKKKKQTSSTTQKTSGTSDYWGSKMNELKAESEKDDIAPVKQTAKKEDNRTLFQKATETVVDFGATTAGTLGGLVGFRGFENDMRAFVDKDLFDKSGKSETKQTTKSDASTMTLDDIKLKLNETTDDGDRVYWQSQYNQRYIAEKSEILSKTKMDGTGRTVLEEMQIIAEMKNGDEKDKRKKAVFGKLEELGIDTKDYALFAGDDNFSWDTFWKWLGNSALSGLGSFNKGITSTADFILGQPLTALGWEDNPISKMGDYYRDAYDVHQFDKNYYASQLGGKGWNFAGDAVEGTVGAIPNAIAAFMTMGSSTGATMTDLGTKAAYEAGNLLSKIGMSVSSMLKNPQYWLSFAQTLGTDYEEAKAKGADDATAALGATLSSLLNAGIEIGVDGMSGIQGLPHDLGKGGNKLIDWALSSVEEGGEEVAQGLISNIVSKTFYDNETEIINPKESLKEFALGTLSGMALGGGQVAANSAINAYQTHQENKLTENENAVVEKLVNDRVAEKEKDGTELSDQEKNNIRKEFEEAMRKGEISTDDIESVLGGETYKSYQDTIASEESAIKELESLFEGEELDNAIKGILDNSKRGELKNQLEKEVFDLAVNSKDSHIYASYSEKAKRSETFTADLSKYDSKYHATIRKAVDSGILNNTRRTHEFVDMVAKISADKGVLFDFTNNEKLAESGFAVNGKSVNGYYANGGVTVNIDSEKSLNSIVGHEITHVLEGTEVYDALQETIFEYAKTKGVYESMLKDTYDLYKNIEGYKGVDGFKAIKREVVSDLVGDYLFTDADFIKNLSTNNRNVFQKIYDEIKYLCKLATAGSKEARELERVKHAFEQAYKGEGKANTDTKYSVSDKNIKDVSTGYGYGETYFTMSYTQDGKTVGKLDYGVYEGEPNVKMIEVSPEYRRQGIGTKLLQELQKKYPDTEIDFGMSTPDGTKLLESVTYDVTDEAVMADRQKLKDLQTELNELQGKLDILYDTENLTAEQETELEKLGDRWEEVYHAIYDLENSLRGKKAKKTFVKTETKYSLSDSDGKKLTKEQNEYFKNSKMRDENGALKVMYHGSQDSLSSGKAHGKYNIYGKDVKLEQDIAPVGETVETVGETVGETVPQTENKVAYDLSPEPMPVGANEAEIAELESRQQSLESRMTEAYQANDEPTFKALYAEYETLLPKLDALKKQAAEAETTNSERLESLNEAPPETEAPYYGESEEAAPDDPFLERDIDDVGNRKVKAYMYENPEVKSFFQEEANVMLGELRRTTKGERWYNDKMYYETNGERGFFGTQRHTSNDIAYLLDERGYTYAEIEKGLKDIIEDNGKENNACSKRIEFLLNDRLLKGYQDMDGVDIPANEDYIRLLRDKEIIEYNDEARKKFFEVADDYAPVYEQQELFEDIEKPAENTAPVREVQQTLFETSEVKKPIEKKPFRGEQQKMFGTPEEEKIAKVLVEEPEAPKQKSRTWSQTVIDYVDKGAPVEKLALETKNRELQSKYNFMHYSENRAQSYIEKHLKPIVDKVEKLGEEKTKQFFNYAYHLHNIDRMSIDTEENRAKREELRWKYFDGMSDKKIEQVAHQWITHKTPKEVAERIKAAREYVDASKTKNKPVYGDSVTADVSREFVKRLEKANPEFIEFEQAILEYNTALRKLLVDNNVISQETADLWAKMYPHYVPIRREGHDGANINVPLDTKKTGVNAPIKRATGGNSNILPLFNTMATRTEQTFKAIARNNFGLELMHTLNPVSEKTDAGIDEIMDAIDNQDELMNKGELLKKGENGKAPTFTVFENGKRVEFEITEDLYDAMKPVSERLSKTYLSSKAVDAFKKVTTTYSPKFMVSNPIKDFQDIILNSQHPMKTYANMPKAFLELATHGRYYTEYMENGGEQNTYFDSKKMAFTEDSLAKKIALGLPRGINMANDFFERAPRLAEYMASRKKGASIETAMLDAARVTTNFTAGGDVTKFVGRNFVPFLNPSVQGAAQQVRNVREAVSEGFTGVLKLAGRYAAASIPVLMFNALMWDDDEEYEELSDYVKENYYVVAKFDDGKFVRIPKGRTVAVIQSAVEQALNALNGEEADFGSTGKLALSNLAPNNPLDSNILSTFIQIKNNKTWYGEDLVPSRLQDMPEAEQYDESIDLVSRWLAEKLNKIPNVNVSPYHINYFIDQYTGGIGDMILPMITPETAGGEDTLSDYAIAPWKDLFTTDSVMKNQNVSDFYETMDELTKNANSAYATDEDILASKYMNSVNAELGKLYAKKREIQSDTTIPKDRKYTLVRRIQEQIDALAKESLGTYGNVSIEDGYASVGDLHYRTNKDGAWEKISDKQLEKQNNVTRGLGISASEYWSNKEEYDYAYDYPEKYAVAKAVGGYESYKTYSSELYDIKADKDENGKSISGSRKEKVIDYINNLDADYYEKIILFKSEYNADDTYNYDIVDYLNNHSGLTYKDIETILKELGFTVDSKGNISW